MLPADLQLVLENIDAADRAADAIAASCNEDQFHWRPRQGAGWSIAQCLDHLATINVVYGNAIRAGIDRARARGIKREGPGVPGFFGALFIKSLEPPVKRRMRAPGNTRPASWKSREEILQSYHAAHQRIRDMIADAVSIDTNRATFTNPFIRIVKVRVATGFNVIGAHNRRHLWQAEQVRKEPDYPGCPGVNG